MWHAAMQSRTARLTALGEHYRRLAARGLIEQSMHSRPSQKTLQDLIETLATIEHERWSHWQRDMHSRCERKPDGSLVISPELVVKWERQITTAYNDLTDLVKESDR